MHDSEPHGFIVHRQRRRHAPAPVRRVDAEVQVLDALAGDLDAQAADVEVVGV